MTLNRVHVLNLGGTITRLGPHRLDYYLYTEEGPGRITADEMLSRIPEVKSIANVTSEDFKNISSTEITPNDWLEIAKHLNDIISQKPEVSGVVVTHGTAALEETSYFLDLTIKSDKPVVITGAMRPPSSMGTDADINLLNAIIVSSTEESRSKGVLAVLNNQIHTGRDAIKMSTLRVETFWPNQWGFLGYIDSDLKVIFHRSPIKKHTKFSEFNVNDIEKLPRVDIIPTYVGSDETLINAAVSAHAEGLIIAGMGNGLIPPAVEDAAIKAAKKGLVIVRASRSPTGRVLNSPKSLKLGLLSANDLVPQKARVLLMLALTVTRDPSLIQKMFEEY